MQYENKANNKSLECQPISLRDEFTNSCHALVTQCNVAKFLIAALSGPASCRTGPIRQLAGPDGQTSCLLSDRP